MPSRSPAKPRSTFALGAAERASLDINALTSLVSVALLIAYLPMLYSPFNLSNRCRPVERPGRVAGVGT
jgi:hypothetical protein